MLTDRNEPCFCQGSTKIFLDSNDLTNLSKLIENVGESGNHIIMLTRAALERPYVLCELAYAFKQNKKVVCVLVNWPGVVENDHGKTFLFPQHLDEAIADWEVPSVDRPTSANE